MPESERLRGRYVLGDKLGEGGMGLVYRGRADGAAGFAKAVAIKTIHDHLARDPGIREMFVAEARTAQRLQHGGIVQIIDVGLDDGTPYLVIELVEGASLAELLRACGRKRLPVGEALFIAESVASALAYAHGLTDKAGRPDGIVHRDVTPRNVLIGHDGVVKLADFGIAKALAAPSYTVPGTFKGSIGYLAPEQARGEAVDARADQFALGIVLHEMLAGRNPIAARGIEAYLAALAEGIPSLPADGDVDAALAAIVARATAIEPDDRYVSLDELRGELEAWRVARKLRTSTEALRATMRVALGDDATVPTGVALGDALAGVLSPQTPATEQIVARQAADGASKRGRWRYLAVGLALLAVAGVAYAIGTRSSGSASARGANAPDAGAIAGVLADAAPDVLDTPARVAQDVPVDAGARPIDAGPPRPVGSPRTGTLRVNVVPWARVVIDNKPLGGVPFHAELSAGRHELVLENDSGDRVKKTITIEPGRELVVTRW